jgi:hypothetical protein
VVTQKDSIYLMMNFHDYNNKFIDTPKFLIKLFDDTIIELGGYKLSSATIDESDIVISGMSFPIMVYETNLKFLISKEQMSSFKKGIKKIRFNTSPKYREKEWRKDKIGKEILKEYESYCSISFKDNF